MPGQQVLVIATDLNSQLGELAARLVRSGTLIITDNANDKKSVMINLTYPDNQSIRFEINKSNIVYEGLKITNDVRLYGGSEIEVATLYKEMEFLLRNIKSEVENARRELKQKAGELNTKNNEINTLKQQAATITELLQTQDQQINAQQQALLSLDTELQKVTTALDQNQQLLEQREKAVSQLAVEIAAKQQTLHEQEMKIAEQEQLVEETTHTVTRQDATIASQRNIIFMAMVMLLAFLLLVINRQKKALTKERQLLETRNELLKTREEAIRAYESSDRLKNDFLTAISHEMRTPMNGILGAVQIADAHDVVSMRNSIDMISHSSGDMMNLIDSVLSYVEIQSGQMKVIHDATSLSELFASLRQNTARLCQQKTLQLNWHVSDNLPPLVMTDTVKLTKILQKLLDNAIKFTDSGAITLIVRYHHEQAASILSCTVKDTGPGIPEELQQHIFEAFWQQESGFARSYNGLGIGLTICQKLAELMGGKISMSSSRNTGSQFTLELPIAECTGTGSPSSELHSSRHGKVLLVEDNIINQQVLSLMLQKLGHEVVIANDGVEALNILQEQTPSLILMDLQMPNMDGFSCTRHIRARPDDSSRLPIVAITANLMESERIHCTEAGMNGYLGKPVSIHDLKKMLDQFNITSLGPRHPTTNSPKHEHSPSL